VVKRHSSVVTALYGLSWFRCQADEFKSRISVLDKSIEDLTGKLKSEEAKRKELETRVKQLSNESQSTKTENKTEDKATAASVSL